MHLVTNYKMSIEKTFGGNKIQFMVLLKRSKKIEIPGGLK